MRYLSEDHTLVLERASEVEAVMKAMALVRSGRRTYSTSEREAAQRLAEQMIDLELSGKLTSRPSVQLTALETRLAIEGTRRLTKRHGPFNPRQYWPDSVAAAARQMASVADSN